MWIMNDNNYPEQDTWGTMIQVFTEPFPQTIFKTYNDNYPDFDGQTIIPVVTEPLPQTIFIAGNPEINNGYPSFVKQNPVTMGAFNRTKLSQVSVPNTVTSIGELSFAESLIKSITINENCTYYNTSFPEDCDVVKVTE